MHDHHEQLEGYSPNQVLVDGCGECESRAKGITLGISELDRHNFARAWQRAAQWNRDGLPDLAKAEVPMFRVLWAIQVKLENRGIPIGELPTGF